VLSDTRPRIVADRTCFEEKLCGFRHLCGLDPGDGLDPIGRVFVTQVSVQAEGGSASNRRAVRRYQLDRRLELGNCRLEIGALRRRIANRQSAVRIPCHEIVVFGSRRRRREIASAQESVSVVPDQQRTIGPVADKFCVEPAVPDHLSGDAERQRAVGARPHAEPLIGAHGKARAPGIDHDEARAAGSRRSNGCGVIEPGCARVVPPQHDAARFLEIGRRDRTPERKGMGVILVPIADLGAIRHVRAAEGVDETLDPAQVVRDRGAARGRQAEGDRLRTRLAANAIEFGRGPVERLLPGDPLPARVGSALRPCPLERIELALRIVDDLGGCAALDAERLTGRMFRIWFLADEAAFARHQDSAAARLAERTKSRRSGFRLAVCFQDCTSVVASYAAGQAIKPIDQTN
jgi:hypothetical protein